MGMEIERRFLAANSSWKEQIRNSERISQGYLATDPAIRVRLSEVKALGQKTGFLTIKGKPAAGFAFGRKEFEYSIPWKDAQNMLTSMLQPRACEPHLGLYVSKTRHHLLGPDGKEWVVDEFNGLNEGLVLAEIELSSEDESFEKPMWVGEEVTFDYRYANSQLAEFPYREWRAIKQE